jgi:thioredoxin-like negative regulator of GroEL
MTGTICAAVLQTALLLLGADAAAVEKVEKKDTPAATAQSPKSQADAKQEKSGAKKAPADAKQEEPAEKKSAEKKSAEKESHDTYADAKQATEKSDKPMVVIVGADWCSPCQTMKKSILPQVREHGLLKKVAFAVINFDRQRGLAQKITGGGPIPQLIMFRRTKDGWAMKKLVGSQSVEAVEQFINDGLASNKSAETSDGESESAAPPETGEDES